MIGYNPMLLCDWYKQSHVAQYPPDTEIIYSTWIPRDSRIPGVEEVVAFGFQAFIMQWLISYFDEWFFTMPWPELKEDFDIVVRSALGIAEPDSSHFQALHELGYLPLRIRAVPEGTLVPIRVPMLTIENTMPEFYWVTNFIETLFSAECWMPSTSATIALEFRKIFDRYAKVTGYDKEFVQWQGHDFSMRGMASLSAAAASGAAHLLSFSGTDTIPGMLFARDYYDADLAHDLVGGSVPATEHSVMCAYGQDEHASFERLLTEVYPTGIVSVVSDTYDLWKILGEVLPGLRDVIMERDGRLVIRPDSGDPVKIVCGDPDADGMAQAGAYVLLCEVFGADKNDKGYMELDTHVGLIYGDAINLDRCERICAGLEAKGIAPSNLVLGIGSFSYQFQSRDTFGFALKSTWAQRNGQGIHIFKDPVTDDGMKRSLTGRVGVVRDGDTLKAVDHLDEDLPKSEDVLEDVFIDGDLIRKESFSTIRARLTEQRELRAQKI
jgi:nicotinamide phosphoribosyltransferase